LQSLGSSTKYNYSGPDAKILEVFPNQYPEYSYTVCHETEEFSSLCPKTGQPDFATIQIVYMPRAVCIESKSLKLYLGAFRNEGSFMETIVNRIKTDLVEVLSPAWIHVVGEFKPRGGIKTKVSASYYARVEEALE
jgi:7-cyano-7-deazaguanine reductase